VRCGGGAGRGPDRDRHERNARVAPRESPRHGVLAGVEDVAWHLVPVHGRRAFLVLVVTRPLCAGQRPVPDLGQRGELGPVQPPAAAERGHRIGELDLVHQVAAVGAVERQHGGHGGQGRIDQLG